MDGPWRVCKPTFPVRRFFPGLQATGGPQAAWPSAWLRGTGRTHVCRACPGSGPEEGTSQSRHWAGGPGQAEDTLDASQFPAAQLPALLTKPGRASHVPAARWPGARLALQDEPASREPRPITRGSDSDALRAIHRRACSIPRERRLMTTNAEACGEWRLLAGGGHGWAAAQKQQDWGGNSLSQTQDGWLCSHPPSPTPAATRA